MGGAALLVGCADSASHDVLSTYAANDDTLSCQQINAEITKAQLVIDSVNKDKEDLTAADITDGILWFPFNLIAKNGNYNDATKAADGRISHLNELKKNRNCPTIVQNDGGSNDPVERLAKLQELYKGGTLTQEEFEVAKQKILSEI